MRQTGMLAMIDHDLITKYDTLEQTANVLKLEKEEFSKEICKLHQENEQLEMRCNSLKRQHTEIFHNKRTMANVLSSKSTALDVSHITIQKQQSQILVLQQKIKILRSSNNNLITENNKYKQRLEELKNESIQRNEIYGKEKDGFIKQIKLLHDDIDHLQHLLHVQTSSAVHIQEECKCNQYDMDKKEIHHFENLGRNKTIRYNSLSMSLDETAFDYDRDSIISPISQKRMSGKRMNGMDYNGVYQFKMPSLNGTPHLGPLMDSPKSDGLLLDDEYSEYDAAGLLTDEYEHKLAQLISKHKNENKILTDKYEDVVQRLEEIQSEFDETKVRLNNKLKIIKDLRAQNYELAKKSKPTECYVFDWFNRMYI